MECRRTVVTGGVLRSPPPASATPLTMAAGVMRHRSLRHGRLYDCDDEVVDEYNNNNNNSNVYATTVNNTTQLVDELEQLRTDNFQLRLRVYNAERRVDKLSAAALDRDREKRSNSTNTDSDDTDDSSDHSDTDHNTAAAKATAEAAVRTIHDLLTVNRRLLALLAAIVSAKAVSVSADDKRRWRQLRRHIEKYTADGTKEKKTNNELDEDDDEFHDASATESDTSCKSRVASAERSATRQNVLRSPPPPPVPSSSAPLETTGEGDEGAGSEVSRLRGRCRRLERSLQQLVNTELWARNRQIGKLEQQKYATQVADAAAQKDRKPAEVVAADVASPQQHYLQQFRSKAASTAPLPAVTKGILVKRLPAETSTATTASTVVAESQNHRKSPLTVTTITTPPPVLPDYSEVNFFFSCDEEEDDDDDDSAEMNTSSSPEEETADSNDCRGDEKPVRLTAIGAPVSSTSTRKRHCRPHHRQLQQPTGKGVGDAATVTTTSSSSTESDATADEADDLTGDGVTVKTTAATSPTARSRTVSGGGLHRRRRCRPPRRCSTCGRCSGVADAAEAAADRAKPPPSVNDVQVQCGDGNVTADHDCSNDDRDVAGESQLQLLRRELDARRRENGRLYDMLLRLQRGTQSGDRGKGDGGPRIPSSDLSDSDPSGSPEPYRRAAGAVRGRIADLLPPLLSMRSISDDDDDDDDDNGGRQRDQPDGAEQQQQQQLMLLTRLRERIVAYERRELNGGDDRAAVRSARPEDTSNDAVRRMDRADLVNVALPRVVERLCQALVPLLQHRRENDVGASAGAGRSLNVGDGDALRPSPPREER
ncbi:uncharacterized protein LOC113549405 [Rhopalosiphum maidis]|uniref:uncharacterized protein LOC113549405 n=1 Tax=Rhopalosiphum maidis TaxID=43146 RepID=UPI000EFE6DED|nr:uncharacterized protein LOC113549405 [Rhopalosiphum maidis]